MSSWIADLERLDDTQDDFVLVTVANVRGSAPREPGAKMIVTSRDTIGTIGGGQLEYQCTRIAVQHFLRNSESTEQRIRRRFPLGSNCGQCCGGVVDVVFERASVRDAWLETLIQLHAERVPAVLLTSQNSASGHTVVTSERVYMFDSETAIPERVLSAAGKLLERKTQAEIVTEHLLEPVLPSGFNVVVFGAGHVGAATVDVLSRTDCQVRWVDSRRSIFPAKVATNVTAVETGHPTREVAAMSPGAVYLIMTHSHALDFELCGQILARGDAAYCGLIGSVSKRRRFERDLRKQGIGDAQLEHLTCPIGVSGIRSKKPVDIAIAVSAELLRIRDAADPAILDNTDMTEQSTAKLHVL